ncbi:DUF397 domain-containing protein [Actinoallomurus sp. NPDC052274]
MYQPPSGDWRKSSRSQEGDGNCVEVSVVAEPQRP